MNDLIIIGAGPAGMTAAIYAARQKIKFLILSLDVGGQMGWSSDVDNYPGVPDESGIALVQKFQQHLKEYKIQVKQEEVVKLEKKGKFIEVRTKKNKYQTKAVVIASGKAPRKLNVPGEDKFLGKGVSYCATCDAPLHKNKIVAVVGSGNSGLDASLLLSKYAKKVYLLEFLPKLGGESYLRDKVLVDRKIEVIMGAKVKEILGNKFVKALVYEKKGKQKKLAVEGVFVEVGLISQYDFTNVKKNKWGEIMIFRSTKTNEENMTSEAGIFAAGDCTDIPAKQIIVAAGEGAKAAIAAFDYIKRWK
ncbi:MAG: FAD-dependent oxidoreductase [bacterium]|nr:FAD-dependent oxidoreductase [bacterium]